MTSTLLDKKQSARATTTSDETTFDQLLSRILLGDIAMWLPRSPRAREGVTTVMKIALRGRMPTGMALSCRDSSGKNRTDRKAFSHGT
jgi:hypothetical protein